MKKMLWIACCALLAASSAATVSAQPISVQITGHITQWWDSTGLVGPYLSSQTVTATYTYDPSGPVIPVGGGQYTLPAGSSSIVVNAGPFVFQTGGASVMQARIMQGVPGNTWGQAEFQGYQNPSLPNGLSVDLIDINLMDPSGQWPSSYSLPDGVPNLASYANSQVMLMGSMPTAGNYQIMAQIDSVQLLPPAIEVSPKTGTFIPQQHFDAAVLLPLGGAPVATVEASVGGTPLALSYPGTCQLATPTSSGRAALLCPGADAAMAAFQGITQIDWRVTLADGSSLTQSVQWNLIR
ncbi:MAG TPA: hypothetical protein VI653_04115 [Steroidobacteraceae bacterium]